MGDQTFGEAPWQSKNATHWVALVSSQRRPKSPTIGTVGETLSEATVFMASKHLAASGLPTAIRWRMPEGRLSSGLERPAPEAAPRSTR